MLRTFDRDAQQLKNIRHLNPLSADSSRVTPAFMQPFAPPPSRSSQRAFKILLKAW